MSTPPRPASGAAKRTKRASAAANLYSVTSHTHGEGDGNETELLAMAGRDHDSACRATVDLQQDGGAQAGRDGQTGCADDGIRRGRTDHRARQRTHDGAGIIDSSTRRTWVPAAADGPLLFHPPLR